MAVVRAVAVAVESVPAHWQWTQLLVGDLVAAEVVVVDPVYTALLAEEGHWCSHHAAEAVVVEGSPVAKTIRQELKFMCVGVYVRRMVVGPWG